MDEVAFLEQLVSIPSPSGEEKAVGEFLVEQMADMVSGLTSTKSATP